MEYSLIASLKTTDSELKTSLKNCKEPDEAWSILKNFEERLNTEISDLESRVDGQKLLNELHRYNDMKDMAQAVIGNLANIQGVTVAKIHRNLGLDIE